MDSASNRPVNMHLMTNKGRDLRGFLEAIVRAADRSETARKPTATASKKVRDKCLL